MGCRASDAMLIFSSTPGQQVLTLLRSVQTTSLLVVLVNENPRLCRWIFTYAFIPITAETKRQGYKGEVFFVIEEECPEAGFRQRISEKRL